MLELKVQHLQHWLHELARLPKLYSPPVIRLSFFLDPLCIWFPKMLFDECKSFFRILCIHHYPCTQFKPTEDFDTRNESQVPVSMWTDIEIEWKFMTIAYIIKHNQPGK